MFFNKKLQVAILDTGIDLAQCPAVSVLASRSFVNQQALKEKHGHGTLMFKILLQRLKKFSVFPLPDFIIAQVINRAGLGTGEQICQAFEWLHLFAPDLILIPSGFRNPPDKLYPLLKKSKLKSNCTIIAAAGNLYAGQKNALYPAAWSEVISVGASTDQQAYSKWNDPPNVIIDFSTFRKESLVIENESTSAACLILGAQWIADHIAVRCIDKTT